MLQENFIALLAQDRGADAKAMLQDDLSNRVLASLEERKRELAQGLFSGQTEQVTEEKDEAKKDEHSDEVEDTKLVKKLVKKDCLTKEETQIEEAKVRPHKDPEKGWVGQSKAYYKAVQKKRQTPEERKAWIKQSEANRK